MQDPELVKQLKERLPEALFEKLNDSLSIDRDRLRFAEYKVRVLEERLRLVRIEKYGPGSEKRSDAQLELLDVFEAYLKYPVKCWLRSTGEISGGNIYSEWLKAQNESYRVNE